MPSAATSVPVTPAVEKGGKLPPGVRPVKPQGHLAAVTCLAFSADGRRLVSGSEDSTLLVWDVESGEIVQRLEGHQGFVSACAFLPGERVVSGGWDGEVVVWDAGMGQALRKLGTLPSGHDVATLGISAAGREVLAGTSDGRVIGWNPDTGEETFPANDELTGAPNASKVLAVGFLSDGRRFAGGDSGKTIVWGKSSSTKIEGIAASGVALPGGQLALGREKSVALVAGGKVARTLEGHQKWVYGLAVSPAGERLLAADDAGRGRVWQVASGNVACSLDAKAGHRAAAWSPAGDRVAVAGDEGLVRVGDVAACSGGQPLPLRTLGTARGRVRAVAAGSSVWLGDSAGRVSTWDPATWQLTASTPAHGGEVKAITALSDGRWVSGGADRFVVLGGAVAQAPGATSVPWTGRGPAPAGSPSPSQAGAPMLTSASGQRLASEPAPRKLAELRNQVWAIALLPGGASVLAADSSGDVTEILLGEPATRRQGTAASRTPALVTTHRWTAPDVVYALAVEPGGTAALVGGVWNTVVRLPLTGDAPPAEWPESLVLPEASTTELTFLPDGRYVQASTDGDVLVRRAETVEKRLTGLTKHVSALAVAGPHLWAGGYDRVLVRWALDDALAPDLRIDEGTPILGLATTPGGFLIAGLADGRASVRRLPDGALVAHLYPFRDGSGATIFADGTYHATPGDAYALRLEDPTSRKVVTLGDLLRPHLTQPQITPLPDGSVVVRATVFSPTGPPTVTLDGGWTVEAVAPSPTALLAYEVELQLVEPRGGRHTLTAQPPEGDAAQVTFDVLPDPRLVPGKGRALVLGNSAYQHRAKLPGAARDVALVRAFLESAESWRLGPDRIETRADLTGIGKDGGALRSAVSAFFARAEADETLFFYFSGHGESDGGQGYLLPVDAPENSRTGALSVTDLWSIIRTSKAGRILVILDACRAGSFAVPPDLALQRKAVVLAATEAGGAARDLTSGGAFTRALLGAATRSEAFDADLRAVTVLKAFYVAANDVSAQAPMMYGMGELLRLPLAWPPPKKVDRRAASDVRGSGDTGFRSARADLEAATDRGAGAAIRERDGKLEVVVVFDQPTEAVKLSGYQPKEGYDTIPRVAARPQRIHHAPAGVWPEGKEVTLPLWNVKTDKGGLVELRTCSAAGKCGLPRMLALPAPK